VAVPQVLVPVDRDKDYEAKVELSMPVRPWGLHGRVVYGNHCCDNFDRTIFRSALQHKPLDHGEA